MQTKAERITCRSSQTVGSYTIFKTPFKFGVWFMVYNWLYPIKAEKTNVFSQITFLTFYTCVRTPKRRRHLKIRYSKRGKLNKTHSRSRLSHIDNTDTGWLEGSNEYTDAPDIHPFQRISSQTILQQLEGREIGFHHCFVFFQDNTVDELDKSWTLQLH